MQENLIHTINVRLPKELLDKLDELCQKEQRSRSTATRMAIEYYLNNK